jgi:hypothetical protein
VFFVSAGVLSVALLVVGIVIAVRLIRDNWRDVAELVRSWRYVAICAAVGMLTYRATPAGRSREVFPLLALLAVVTAYWLYARSVAAVALIGVIRGTARLRSSSSVSGQHMPDHLPTKLDPTRSQPK